MTTGEPSIVIAYPTVMDGLCLRWYRDVADVDKHKEFMSVSRNGCEIYCSASEVPPADAAVAAKALSLLGYGEADKAAELATHRFTRFMGRDVELDAKARIGDHTVHGGIGWPAWIALIIAVGGLIVWVAR